MSHIFLEVDCASPPAAPSGNGRDRREWAIVELDGVDALAVTATPDRPVRQLRDDSENDIAESDADVAVLRRARAGEAWALLCPDATRVNGLRLATGLRVLRDRDEVLPPGGPRFFFSTERLARIERFPGADAAVYCPRCKTAIEAGEDAVRCPVSGLGHHQSERFPCWTYAETCACGCGQPTDLGSGYRWTPEGL